jgi:hypothetical protein
MCKSSGLFAYPTCERRFGEVQTRRESTIIGINLWVEASCVVSATYSYGLQYRFSRPKPLFFFIRTVPQLSKRGWVDPVPDPVPTPKITCIERHPCLEWDSNTRLQSLSQRRRFMPQTARPLRTLLPSFCYKDHQTKDNIFFFSITRNLKDKLWWPRHEILVINLKFHPRLNRLNFLPTAYFPFDMSAPTEWSR